VTNEEVRVINGVYSDFPTSKNKQL